MATAPGQQFADWTQVPSLLEAFDAMKGTTKGKVIGGIIDKIAGQDNTVPSLASPQGSVAPTQSPQAVAPPGMTPLPPMVMPQTQANPYQITPQAEPVGYGTFRFKAS